MFRFASPWMFLLLALIPLAAYLRARFGKPPALRFSSSAKAQRSGASLRQKLLSAPFLMRVTALFLIVVALARPQYGTERVRDVSRGIAIEMVVDRSSSMGAEMVHQGQVLTRLDAVKRVFRDFVRGDGKQLHGRPNDLIGMITFARYADTVCPLTLAHGALDDLIESVRLVEQRSEDGTAIGDAVALAAARLETAEEALQKRVSGSEEAQPEYQINSKVIILLTDGENNAGERSVQEAAEMAAKWGIKVYAIGVGGEVTLRTPFGAMPVPGASQPVDTRSLQTLAETTGGLYRVATSANALREVYAEIDQLERSEIESVRYLDHREMFPPFALTGFFLIAFELGLAGTLLRRVP